MKIYTTMEDLVKPTIRFVVKELEKKNGKNGVALKLLRKAVLEEYKPLMTLIDHHFCNTKLPMIQRTFNNMIYSKKLEKSGYGVYDQKEKLVMATEKAIKEFTTQNRLKQADLVLPALICLKELAETKKTDRIKTSDLFALMKERISENLVNEEDLIFNTRKEARYLQVMRNLVSHRVLDRTKLVRYHSETKEFELLKAA